MRRLFLIAAVVVLVMGSVPVSAADDDFECDGLAATIVHHLDGGPGDDILKGGVGNSHASQFGAERW